MADLIDRQATLKHIEKIRQAVQMMDDTHRASIIMNGMNLCEEAVKNQPSAEPEIAKKLYLYKCYITDEDGLQHEVIHTGDIRRVTGWEI